MIQSTEGQAPNESLTQSLLKEDPSRLVADARKSGNQVRGAILFHQGNINCANCHRPKSEADRIGPDLSKLKKDVTSESIVESILNPSKVIQEEFRSYDVLMFSGEKVLGQLVQQNDRELVLRSHDNIDRTRRLLRSDIDEFEIAKTSSMPDDLCDQLKNRQQFLDLLRYVLEIKERGPVDEAIQNLTRKPLTPRLKGQVLMDRLQCVSCHKPGDSSTIGAAKKAPDLRWSASHLNPAYLEKLIARPHLTKPGTAMPDLMGKLTQAERDEQAKALTHYLVSQTQNDYRPTAADPIAAGRGRALFHQVGCVACHAARDEKATEIKMKDSIALGDLTEKYDHDSLLLFLKNPHQVRASDRMPNLNLKHWEASDIAHYLLSQTRVPGRLRYTLYSNILKDGKIQLDGNAVRGGLSQSFSMDTFDSFNEESAVRYEGYLDVERAGVYEIELTVNGAGLLKIEDQEVISIDAQPDALAQTKKGSVRLAAGKSKFELTYYLIRGQKQLKLLWKAPGAAQASALPIEGFSATPDKIASPEPFKLSEALAKKGHDLFANWNCAKCHDQIAANDRLVQSRLEKQSYPAWEKLSAGKGCVSADTGNWPAFDLTAAEREAINAALAPTKAPETSVVETRILRTLATFNCLACHDRNQMGGVTDIRNAHFKTDNLNLGEQGRIPPTLTGVGAKLNPKWMRDVLVQGRSIRPYMKTRMPKYQEPNIQQLLKDFQAADSLKPVKHATFKDQKETRKIGLQLVGDQGLNCVACHTYKFKTSDTMPAVDLTEMAERLNKDWYYEYMLAPQKFSPNTVMPSFWPGGKAMRHDFLDGDSKQQLEAIWQYLRDGRQAGTPRGVVRKRLEIVVKDEARMLRRSYPNIGKRGIGVGYPGGINIAYDAEQMRLGLIWNGKFADPGGVWTGQGSGNVRPMGRPLSFEKGPDLDDAMEPWIPDDGRPPHHQFKGYVLDQKQRPTFKYRFAEIEIEDYCREKSGNHSDTPTLIRTLTLQSKTSRKGLHFRVASGKKIEQKKPGEFLVDDRLLVRCDGKPEIVKTLAGMKLMVPVEVTEGSKTKLEMAYDWQKP